MRSLTVTCVLWLYTVLQEGAVSSPPPHRYTFWRSVGGSGSVREHTGRRVFGGAAASLQEWGGVCALLDRYWAPRCSGSVLAPRWVITAGHCISSRVAYVKYNTRTPLDINGNVTAIQALYRHPKYKVVQLDEGRGIDVTQLQNDVGLVRTQHDMSLLFPTPPVLLRAAYYDPADLLNEEITVLGFGRTEMSNLGEELFSVRLRLSECERSTWQRCLCGVTSAAQRRGVCSGDSGGPVLYRGTQIGVTSMGPVECALASGLLGSIEGATSVFTMLHTYTALVNSTLSGADTEARMLQLSAALTHTPTTPLLVLYVMFTYYI